MKTPFTWAQRHPRLLLAVLSFGLCAYWFFLAHKPPRPVVYTRNPELKTRLGREEDKYRAMLPQRQALITKYGPTPAHLVMFPPDQDPWPPYTVWDLFPAIFNCPHEVDRMGALGDGGKWLCGLSRIQDKPDCVIYSIGMDSSYSLEATLLRSTRYCQVWIYDSTKGDDASHYIPRLLRHRAHFAKLTLTSSDHHGPNDDPKGWTLKSLMAENGHAHIDFLRLDLEGWEWEAMRGVVSDFTVERATPPQVQADANSTGWTVRERDGVLPFGQLQIELHIWNQRFQDFLEWWELLEVAGLRPFHQEINLIYANYNRRSGVELAEYSFLNTRGENAFIRDYTPAAPPTPDGAHPERPQIADPPAAPAEPPIVEDVRKERREIGS
ncbi:methyltransferase domain-containing protein [Epithele typhae]|uniref:methyltransferase domain-containing protein n=1 Tax=Epithele typhae TaxID=378194 RepID=UPI0020073133|nr:methyltransferase domain-containing protein [Epithele typhae]KAH9926656.1 methyltransferase domain-containing protein [Epithele typhae]